MITSTLWWTVISIAYAVASTTITQPCASKDAIRFAGLAAYPPAQRYCSNLHPDPSTTTVTTCKPSTTSHPKRDDGPQYGTYDVSPKKPTADALFELLMARPPFIIEAVCSCISDSSTNIVTHQISCAANEYCDASGACKISRNCSKPKHCDAQSFCGSSPEGGDCFCHPDTDDGSAGYCMGDGPGGQGCPEPYEDCSSNSDCGGQRVCIYACCRPEPFCVDVTQYTSPNSTLSSRVFRRVSALNPR